MSSEQSARTIYSINPEKSAWRVVDGEAVLIHAETTYYYGLNSVGTEVWKQLLEDDLSALDLSARFFEDGSDPEVTGQVADFLRQLADEDLLETVGERSGEPSDPGSQVVLAGGWAVPEMTRYSALEDLIVCGE